MLKAPHASRSSPPREEQRSLVEQHLDKQARGETASSTEQRFDHSGKRRLGEAETLQLDQDKLRRAIQEEKKRKNGKKDEWEEDGDDRSKKRKTGAMGDSGFAVTEEEMEAYRLNKPNFEDPMANYVDMEDV